MRYSVRQRSARIQAPSLHDPQRLALGAACYRNHCVQCHGGPGVAQDAVGKSLQFLPGSLVDAARRWRPEEVYWITRHGIKMSGMPAWELRLTEEELWAVVAFVDRLAHLTPAVYEQAVNESAAGQCRAGAGADGTALTADHRPVQSRSPQDQAKLALRQYACIACHKVPGLVGPDTHVGPALERFGRREYLPGGLPNNRDNLVRWLRAPAGTAAQHRHSRHGTDRAPCPADRRLPAESRVRNWPVPGAVVQGPGSGPGGRPGGPAARCCTRCASSAFTSAPSRMA